MLLVMSHHCPISSRLYMLIISSTFTINSATTLVTLHQYYIVQQLAMLHMTVSLMYYVATDCPLPHMCMSLSLVYSDATDHLSHMTLISIH